MLSTLLKMNIPNGCKNFITRAPLVSVFEAFPRCNSATHSARFCAVSCNFLLQFESGETFLSYKLDLDVYKDAKKYCF